MLSFNFPLAFSFVYFFLLLLWVSSFFSRPHSFFLVAIWVKISVFLCWLCEIVILFFLLIGSIVSFGAFGSLFSDFPGYDLVAWEEERFQLIRYVLCDSQTSWIKHFPSLVFKKKKIIYINNNMKKVFFKCIRNIHIDYNILFLDHFYHVGRYIDNIFNDLISSRQQFTR